MWYVPTTEYYFAIKGNEKLTYKYWNTVKTSHQVTKGARGQIAWSHLYEASGIGRLAETENRLAAARGGGEGSEGYLLTGYRALFWDDKNVLELDVSCSCTMLCMY